MQEFGCDNFCDIHICIQPCICFQEESPEKQFDAHDCSETEPARRGSQGGKDHQKDFTHTIS